MAILLITYSLVLVIVFGKDCAAAASSTTSDSCLSCHSINWLPAGMSVSWAILSWMVGYLQHTHGDVKYPDERLILVLDKGSAYLCPHPVRVSILYQYWTQNVLAKIILKKRMHYFYHNIYLLFIDFRLTNPSYVRRLAHVRPYSRQRT